MKSLRFFASAALLLVCSAGYCCGPYFNLPEEYYIYRAYDGKGSALKINNRVANVESWKKLYPSIASNQIEEVIYKWDLPRIEHLNENSSKNSFAGAIQQRGDREVVEYLITAKKCEISCAERASKWYYPFKNDPDVATLESVILKAESYKAERLYDRYVLQEVRALFSLARYSDIVNLWERSRNRIREGVIKDMIVGYVAGAEARTGNKEKAIDYYFLIGDYESIAFLNSRKVSGVTIAPIPKVMLKLFAERCPDSPEVPRILQETFYGFEDNWADMSDYYRWVEMDWKERLDKHPVRGNAKEAQEYYALCMKAIRNSKSPAVWYYTAAFLKDILGYPQEASKLLSEAEASNTDNFLGESITVFRIYLDSRISTYDEAYEAKLFKQLKWLDGKIINELDEKIKTTTSDDPYMMASGFSYYYWNDMLRKIIIGEVCPRMEDSGKPVLALRLLNIADNRLVNLVNKRHITWYTIENDKYIAHEKTESMADYRKDTEHSNDHDYSNYLFRALDEMPIKTLVSYVNNAGQAADTFGKWLDERSYIDKDYIQEVIGTRYLRDQEYEKAVFWLSKVSSSYQSRTNIKWYMTRDPFVLDAPERYFNKNYKLAFAQEMLSLQGGTKSKDPDVRGLAMVKMGTGLRSSFTNCWALTQYHKSSGDEWITSEETVYAIKKADEMIKIGLRTIKDPEKAASAYLSQYLYLSVAEKFPDTQVCRKMKAECDKLYDHKKSTPNRNDEYR